MKAPMDVNQLHQIVRHELSCTPPSLIATMGQMAPSTMTDIPAVMDELTLLNSVLLNPQTKTLSLPCLANKTDTWISFLPPEANGQKAICSIPIPAHELALHSFWLTEKVPEAIQNRSTRLVLMYEFKNQILFPEWFILLFWGEQEDFCLPILTHYSILEQDVGDWNETALHRAGTYGLKLEELIAKFQAVNVELNEKFQRK